MSGGLGTSPGRPEEVFGRRRGSRGISMVELLIAASVLTIGLTGVLLAFSPSYTSVTQAGRQDDAVALAYAKLEELRNYPVGSLTSGSDSPTGGYTRTWTTTITSNTITTQATVKIKVTHSQLPSDVNLVTYIVQ